MKPTDSPEVPTSPENEDRHVALLLLWAEAVGDFVCLPPRLRARALARLAEEVRQALATTPDKELIYPWQIRQVNQAFGFEVITVPRREGTSAMKSRSYKTAPHELGLWHSLGCSNKARFIRRCSLAGGVHPPAELEEYLQFPNGAERDRV